MCCAVYVEEEEVEMEVEVEVVEEELVVVVVVVEEEEEEEEEVFESECKGCLMRAVAVTQVNLNVNVPWCVAPKSICGL